MPAKGVEEVSPGVFDFVSSYTPSTRRAYFLRAHKVMEACGRNHLKCETPGCNYYGTETHIHHIDHDITNSRSDNLKYLCVKCHKKEHPERLNFHYADQYPEFPAQ